MQSESPAIRPDSSAPEQKSKARLTGFIHRMAVSPTARKGIMSIGGQAALSLAGLLTATYIGRVGGREQLGMYALALTIVNTMRAVQGELVATPYTIYWHRRTGEQLPTYRGSAVAHQLMLCLATSLGLIGFVACLFWGLGPVELLPTISVLVLASPFILLRCFARHFMFAHMRFGTALVIDVVTATSQMLLLGIAAYYGLLTAPMAFMILGLVCGLATVGWYFSEADVFQFRWADVIADWFYNWKFARWALLSNLVGCSTPYIMPWVLHACHGSAATGLYAAGTTFVGLTYIYIVGIANILTPRATRTFVDEGPTGLKRVLLLAGPVMVLPIALFACAIYLTGDLIPMLCFGDKYAGAGTICGMLAIAAAINSIGVIAGNGLWAIDRPKANLKADGATLLTTTIAAICLVPALGPAGAAISAMLGASLGTMIRCLTFTICLREVTVDGWTPAEPITINVGDAS